MPPTYSKNANTYYVCRYSLAGNMIGFIVVFRFIVGIHEWNISLSFFCQESTAYNQVDKPVTRRCGPCDYPLRSITPK